MESNMSKRYRVKVTEKYVDYVWVEANSREEACDLAPAKSDCMYDLLYDCEVVEEVGE